MVQTLGQTWVKQTSNTSYDLNAVSFVNLTIGWVAGQFSTIRYTLNGGTTWASQSTDVLVRKIQRVFKEGNVGTLIYLADNIIHPDANIETTERVQIQYRIRVAPNVDPFNYPDAGLGSQVITGLGPNVTGSFPFVNMGTTTGDYGLYQAQCPNTVDGYCWAIPMAFVNRRNTLSTGYDPATNANGQNISGVAVRPDLLTAHDVVDADILDARRRIVIPSIDELLNTNFEALMNNGLRTRFSRNTDGGDKYGTELLQLDQIGGWPQTNGGNYLGLTLSQFFSSPYFGQISSTAQTTILSVPIAASTLVPAPYSFPVASGIIYHQNPAYYNAVYISSNSAYNGKPVPGYFQGIGTNAVTFVFSSRANTQTQDTGLSSYQITVTQITYNQPSLINIPTIPQLVYNFSNNNQGFYYQGVLEKSNGKIVEEWNSGISGENNYVMAVPGQEISDAAMSLRASTVELHYFLTLTQASASGNMGIDPGNPNLLLIDPSNFGPDISSPYIIYTVSKVNNVTGGFSYKLKNTTVTSTKVTIETISGYSFVPGTLIEVVGMVTSQAKNFFVRNGATVNFSSPQKSFGTFCRSEVLTGTMASGTSSIIFTTTEGNFIGASTAETITGLTQQIAWLDLGLGAQFYPVNIVGFNTSTLVVSFSIMPGVIPIPGALTGTVTIQVLIKNTTLPNHLEVDPQNPNPGNDGVLIGYYYAPMQTESELPASLTVSMITKPNVMYVSDLGTGGSLLDVEPYDNPLINIPVIDINITNDNNFYNIEPMRFSNFSITGGLASLPVYVPANFQGDLILSALASDNLARSFYGSVSNDFSFAAEGLIIGAPRKMFVAAIGRITTAVDTRFVQGEYVLVIVSRIAYQDIENRVGFKNGDLSAVAIYRLPNKPLSRI